MDTVSDTTVQLLRSHWEEGWNEGDVEQIMAPFAADVVFSSPFVSRVSGQDGRTTIEGRDALRDYVAHALERSPGIAYTVDALYVGTDSIVLVYTCRYPDPARPEKVGADTMRVDGDGHVVEWRCHYDG